MPEQHSSVSHPTAIYTVHYFTFIAKYSFIMVHNPQMRIVINKSLLALIHMGIYFMIWNIDKIWQFVVTQMGMTN